MVQWNVVIRVCVCACLLVNSFSVLFFPLVLPLFRSLFICEFTYIFKQIFVRFECVFGRVLFSLVFFFSLPSILFVTNTTGYCKHSQMQDGKEVLDLNRFRMKSPQCEAIHERLSSLTFLFGDVASSCVLLLRTITKKNELVILLWHLSFQQCFH